jgi:hypothetical protein
LNLIIPRSAGVEVEQDLMKIQYRKSLLVDEYALRQYVDLRNSKHYQGAQPIVEAPPT